MVTLPKYTCDKFVPIEGKPCAHYIKSDNGEAGFCSLGSQFRCTEAVKAKSIRISHSTLQNFMRCKRLCYYSNIVGIRVRDCYMSAALRLGVLSDMYQDMVYTAETDDDVNESFRKIREYVRTSDLKTEDFAKIDGLYQAFYELVKPDKKDLIGVQQHFDIQHWDPENGDILVHGFYDRLHTDHFAENKFTSRPDRYKEAFFISNQVGTYFLADPSLEYVTMELIRRPAIRMRDGEDIGAYGDRIKADVMSRPAYYFVGYNPQEKSYGVKFYRSEFDLAYIRQRYQWVIKELRETAERGSWYMMENEACSQYFSNCDYKAICEASKLGEYNVSDEKYYIKQPDIINITKIGTQEGNSEIS